MARKRMFDNEIINQDSFLDLPKEAIALYFLLGMNADDEGFIAPKKILRLYGIAEDNLKVLVAKNYVIEFETGVIVITDWKRNNYLDKNKVVKTIYQEEKKLLTYNEQTQKYQWLNQSLTEVKPELNESLRSIVENSIEEYSIEENSSSRKDVELYDEKVSKINDLMIECLNTTNINNIKECINYLDKLPIELIEYALKKTARKGAKWDYTMAILDSYIEKHIKTLEQAIADDFNFKNKNKTENKEETQEEKNKRKIKELEELMNANK